MDEVRIRSAFMRNLITSIIGKVMRKKLGCMACIKLNEITVTFDDDKANVHLNADAEMSKTELLKLMKKAGL